MRYQVLLREFDGKLTPVAHDGTLDECKRRAHEVSDANPGCAVYVYDKREGLHTFWR